MTAKNDAEQRVTVMRESQKGRLRDKFNKHVENQRAMFTGYGADKAIESLSTAVRELQDIGLDIHLDLQSTIAGAGFDLVTKITGVTVMRLITTGVLTISGEERLVALSISEGNNDVLKFYISDRCYGGKTLDDDYRGEVYDLRKPAAVYDLQDRIMEIAAKRQVINDCDVSGALGPSEAPVARLQKLKL